MKISKYIAGDTEIWIPVAKATNNSDVRALLPRKGLKGIYRYGYKAEEQEGDYLSALTTIQAAFISNESKLFRLASGKDERQYKAKWRHVHGARPPGLGPTGGWVKIPFAELTTIVEAQLSAALAASNSSIAEIKSAPSANSQLFSPIPIIPAPVLAQRPAGSKSPKAYTSQSTEYERDPEVKKWILLNSQGICECCNEAAPFIATDGSAYLEIHHVKRLADGGSDTTENAVAVCPNCHRELHHGCEAKMLVDELYKNVDRLVFE